MEKVVQIECIEKQLKMTPSKGISALHKLMYEEEGDRKIEVNCENFLYSHSLRIHMHFEPN